jgi:hypothetical protein
LQFHVGMPQMGLYGVEREVKLGGHVCVGQTLRERCQYS